MDSGTGLGAATRARAGRSGAGIRRSRRLPLLGRRGRSVDTAGYYVTEEQGWRFDLFPISKELRYLIPFHEPEETIAHLADLRETWLARQADGSLPPTAPPPLAVYDDDGEKFGGWPGTDRHVYGNGWLERFLSTLEKAVDDGQLRLTTLADYRRAFPPLGRTYIPTCSYPEMLQWSGGFFRNFLVRYDEANLLHKRMLYTSSRVRRRLDALRMSPIRRDAESRSGARPDDGPEALPEALLAWDHVLRAQCNDPYWHGIFGGLYLPHLRQAAHADLLAAERLLGPAAGPALEVLDLDLDAAQEVILRSSDLVAVIRPARGGALVAFDHLPTASALLDVLRRRREPEHGALEQLAARTPPSPTISPTSDAGPPGSGVRGEAPEEAGAPQNIHEGIRMKEQGLEHLLFVDTHARGAFLDHFFPVTTTAAAIHEGRAVELGDFLDVPYTRALPADDSVDSPSHPSRVSLSRSGAAAGHEVGIDKTYRLGAGDDPSLAVTYRVEIGSAEPAAPADSGGPAAEAAQVLFAPEVDLTLLAGWSAERYVMVDDAFVAPPNLAGIASHAGARSVDLVDRARGLRVRLSWEANTGGEDGDAGPVCLHRYGIVTVSQSDDGFERIYQGTALLPAWTIPLQEGAILRIRLRLEVMTG